MQRTHRFRADRAWLPRGVRGARTMVSGGIWASASAAIMGAVLFGGPAVYVMWKGLVLAGAGAAAAGERAGHAMMRRQLRRMARGDIELAEMSARPEGELVVVRGTVQSETLLDGVLVDVRGVYRRMVFDPGVRWVHEAAVDFTLVDERGQYILVQAAGARWMVPTRELVTYPAERFERDGVPAEVRALVRGQATVEATERVLAPGTQVQVVGYKTASADVGGEFVDYREPPQRPTLRSGPDLPLVITAVEDL
jgi:hypothetical protein